MSTKVLALSAVILNAYSVFHSRSQVVRAFRVAATLCAAQLVSSMVDVRKQLQDALAQVIQVCVCPFCVSAFVCCVCVSSAIDEHALLSF